MQTNLAGINLIKSFEGLRLYAYKDSVGVLTIGHGHTKNVRPGMTITQKQAEDFLRADLGYFENAVKKLVRVHLTDNQFAALVSFCFNLGEGNLAKSTLLRKLNAGDTRGAAEEFLKWNKAGGKPLVGLTKRRAAERELFLRP
mgnify:CR=1 FL=1